MKRSTPLSSAARSQLTALMNAARARSPECVELLIKAGADLNLTTQHGVWQSTNGLTALMKAARAGSPECVELLIKAGADVNLEDGEYMSALDHSRDVKCTELLEAAGAQSTRLPSLDAFDAFLDNDVNVKEKAEAEMIEEEGAAEEGKDETAAAEEKDE